jgi:hypothetical protein
MSNTAFAQTASAVDPEALTTTILRIGYSILQAVLGLLATWGIGRLAVRAMDKDRGGVTGSEVITTVLGATGALMAAGIVQFLKTRLA